MSPAEITDTDPTEALFFDALLTAARLTRGEPVRPDAARVLLGTLVATYMHGRGVPSTPEDVATALADIAHRCRFVTLLPPRVEEAALFAADQALDVIPVLR